MVGGEERVSFCCPGTLCLVSFFLGASDDLVSFHGEVRGDLIQVTFDTHAISKW